jgi:tetratricopeptide (TPR) repeat protein
LHMTRPELIEAIKKAGHTDVTEELMVPVAKGMRQAGRLVAEICTVNNIETPPDCRASQIWRVDLGVDYRTVLVDIDGVMTLCISPQFHKEMKKNPAALTSLILAHEVIECMVGDHDRAVELEKKYMGDGLASSGLDIDITGGIAGDYTEGAGVGTSVGRDDKRGLSRKDNDAADQGADIEESYGEMNYVEATMMRARSLLENHQPEEALKLLQDVLVHANEDFLLKAGRACAVQCQYQMATACYEEALKRDWVDEQERVRILIEEGNVHCRACEQASAVRNFEGIAHNMGHERALAIGCFEEALRLDPMSGEAHQHLGEMLLVSETEWRNAIDHLSKAACLLKNPNDRINCLFYLGYLYRKADEIDKVRETYLRVYRENVRFADLMIKLGVHFKSIHDYDMAAVCLRHAENSGEDYNGDFAGNVQTQLKEIANEAFGRFHSYLKESAGARRETRDYAAALRSLAAAVADIPALREDLWAPALDEVMSEICKIYAEAGYADVPAQVAALGRAKIAGRREIFLEMADDLRIRAQFSKRREITPMLVFVINKDAKISFCSGSNAVCRTSLAARAFSRGEFWL